MWRRSQAEGLLASASLPSYRGAGCRGFSIRIGMCHQRPHPLRWDFRDPYRASWSCAMCPRRDAWDTGAGPAGLDRALGDTECAMRVPLAATEWHSILRQLYVCRLPRHSAPPSARSACHSLPSSGAREAARLEGHQRDGRHRMARGSEPSGGGGTGRQRGGLRSLTRRDSRCDPLLRGTVPGRAAHKAASAVDVQGRSAHPWKATIERESAYKVTMR